MNNTSANVGIINIKRITTTDKQGALQYFEGNKDIPFDIKRIYYITETPYGKNRGQHAHKKLKQLVFCPYGKVRMILNNGREKWDIILDKPNIGILLFPCVWRDMIWMQDNSVLCVAVSDYYDENDYIRNYDEFIAYIKEVKYEG